MTVISSAANLFLARHVKTAVNAAKTAAQPNMSLPASESAVQKNQKTAKVATTQKSLIDFRTSFAIKQGGVLPQPIIPEDAAVAETKSIKGSPVVGAPLYDGGFTVSMGPDGTAVCGWPPPTGPVKYPPILEPEEA